ncbi:uncharacterized protein si:dkey-172o19.2 [Etheostoma spectabile]|uniref:uncharacterized protein si:dkey-172o19.2 n=1 Tax=Etheostoma spectabile TaxID=54343 RepID=UPI0013AED227|nr:uncharacterized protein LOC116695690 [Etheostoma spectabile]
MSTSGSPEAEAAAPCQPSSSVESDPDPGLLFPVTRSSLLTQRLLRLRAYSSRVSPVTRRKREMIPTDKKDSTYWDKRNKNNEAAKRSREKRRLNDLMLEGQLLALSEENAQLRAQVLSLQFHGSLRAETCTAASASPLSPRPALCPDLLQPRLWGNSRCNPASVPGAREQGGFNPQRSHSSGAQQGIFYLPGPRARSPRAVLKGGGSAEAEVDAQRHVSSSDDIHNSTDESSIRAFLPTPETLHPASILSYQPRNWLVPHLNHPAVCHNNFLLPWRSSYLAPPTVYPGLPLYIQERHGHGLGVEADIQEGFKSRFSSAPTGLPQP